MVRRQLEKLGLSISESQMSKIENGKRLPEAAVLWGLATVYETDLNDLLKILVSDAGAKLGSTPPNIQADELTEAQRIAIAYAHCRDERAKRIVRTALGFDTRQGAASRQDLSWRIARLPAAQRRNLERLIAEAE